MSIYNTSCLSAFAFESNRNSCGGVDNLAWLDMTATVIIADPYEDKEVDNPSRSTPIQTVYAYMPVFARLVTLVLLSPPTTVALPSAFNCATLATVESSGQEDRHAEMHVVLAWHLQGTVRY